MLQTTTTLAVLSKHDMLKCMSWLRILLELLGITKLHRGTAGTPADKRQAAGNGDRQYDSRVDGLFEKCMNKETGHVIVATDVGSYSVSPFALYCKHFVDDKEQDPADPYMARLAEHGDQHEHEVHVRQYPEAKPVEFETTEDGFRYGISGMAAGTETLLGCPLFFLPMGIRGNPDVLQKVDGKSDLGPYHYVVKEIKLAKNLKKSHILQAACYNLMIGKIQGHVPETFYLINMDQEEFGFKFSDYEDELMSAIGGINAILDGSVPSPIYGSCPYPWKTYGNKKAMESRDISLVSGIGPEKRKALEGRGLTTIDDLAGCGIPDLTAMKGIGNKTATGYIISAKSMVSGKPIRKTQDRLVLPNAKTEIFLDLEGLDMLNAISGNGQEKPQTDYLIGVLVRSNGNERYIGFVAHDAGGEEKMLLEFLDFVKEQKDYAIYHWHHYERTHLSKMMELYGIEEGVRDLVLSESVMFDLHRISTALYAFPVPGTSIKTIAKWMGFEWKHQGDVGAMSSIILYQQYVSDQKSNKDKLDMVLDYNRDDCKATAIIKDWLVRHDAAGQ